MADTDIILTVGLDAKSMNQQVSDLRKEIERQMTEAQKSVDKVGKKASEDIHPDITPVVDTKALEAANVKIKELEDSVKHLQDTLTESAMESLSNMEFSTEAAPAIQHIQELAAEAETLLQNPELEGAEDRLSAIKQEIMGIMQSLQESGDMWEKPSEEVQMLNARVAQLEAELRQVGIAGEQAGQNMGQMVSAVAGGAGGGAAGLGLSVVLNKAFKMLKKIAVTVVGITLGVRGIQSVINKLRSAIREGFKYIYEGDKKFKKQVDDLKKSWAEVKANLAAAFMPLVEIAIPYIQQVIDWINLLISKLAMFIALISGQNEYTKAIKKTGDAAKGAAKQLSKLDELNNLTTNGGSDWSTQKVPVDSEMVELIKKFKAILEEIKRIFDELVGHPFMEGFKSAIGDWQSKLNTIKGNLQNIGIHITDIFSSEALRTALEDYIKSLSKFVGSFTGLLANIGMNIAMAITGGIEQFLADHKLEIQEDLTQMFTIASDIFDNFSQLAIDISSIVDSIGESESLQDTISNLLTVVYELYSALELVALKLVEIASGSVATIIHDNVERIKTTLEGLFEILSKVSEFLSTVATTIKDVLQRLMDEIITPFIEFLTPIISQIVTILLNLWEKLQPIFTYLFEQLTSLWQDYVSPVLNSILDLVKTIMEPIMELLGHLWDGYLKPIVLFIVDALGMLTPLIKINIDGIIFGIKGLLIILDQMIKVIRDAVQFTVAVVKGDWKGAWKAATQYFEDLFIAPLGRLLILFGEHFDSIWEHIKEFVAHLGLALARLFETISNVLISYLNDTIINAVNGLIRGANLIPGVDFEELTPISGKDYHLPNIPALAQGTVIPPSMGQFIARLGDNNKETEVVSPLSTIKDALTEALAENGFGGDITVNLTVDGRVLAETVVKQNNIYRKSTGRSLFV